MNENRALNGDKGSRATPVLEVKMILYAQTAPIVVNQAFYGHTAIIHFQSVSSGKATMKY